MPAPPLLPCSATGVALAAGASTRLGMLVSRQQLLAPQSVPAPMISPAVEARLSRLVDLRAEAAALLSAPAQSPVMSH